MAKMLISSAGKANTKVSMTFQSTISPPGGVWQENKRTGGLNCTIIASVKQALQF
ncbi:hypothetical protein SESBI_17008 [Sesbania bispinosa]|nr:hypothetical protein SESBI_17008 [Sesbania bispinosa]